MDNDAGACLISMQMQLVTLQWLSTNHAAFSSQLISPSVLEKVIRRHAHKVELSHLTDVDYPKMVLPRTSRLYKKGEPSDKFILILEGRAIVTIGQNEMNFEAGPWHCFGTELLDKLVQMVDQPPQRSQQQTPQQKAPATRSSQGALVHLPIASGSISAGAPPEFDAKKVTFVPDFSAVIRDDCTYLEINAQTFLLAYKSTLINKNK